MGRLTNIGSRVNALAPRLVSRADAHGHDDRAEPWRPWYKTRRWKALRWSVLVRDGFTCQCGCGYEGASPELVADHKIPHHGDPVLFWDPGNLETLRANPCHNSRKQAHERRAPWKGAVAKPRGVAASGSMARPTWFRRSHVPLTVVCGPPGAGKSTYVRERAGLGDLIICFDEIATARFGKSEGIRPQASMDIDQIADVLRVRNEQLGDLMRVKAKTRWPAAWLILTEPEAGARTWWAETLGARIVVLATPAEECMRRIRADAERGDIRGEAAAQFAAAWWRQYRPAPCDLTLSPDPGGE